MVRAEIDMLGGSSLLLCAVPNLERII